MKAFFHFGKAELIISLIFVALAAASLGLFYLFPVANASDQTAKQNLELEQVSSAPESKQAEPDSKNKLGSSTRDSIIKSSNYAGPPARENYTPIQKLAAGQTLELNRADSVQLTKVPGIGAAFARRIVRYRERLGGYYTVLQLQEVYGMDLERFEQIRPYLRIDKAVKKLNLARISPDSLPRHPYLNYKQRSAMRRILQRDGQIESWSQLLLLPEFAADDSLRLAPYFCINQE